MQNDPFSSFGLPADALDAAFARAQAELRAAAGRADDGRDLDEEVTKTRDGESRPSDDLEPLLDGDELLHVVRDPVEWLLSLAHRLASGDADDVAAVDRLRAAFHGRLAGRPTGVRMNDALTAFGLLVGALDPRVVLESVTKTIADGVATILSCEGAAFAAQLCGLADSFSVRPVHHARTASTPSRRRGRSSRAHHTP